MKTAVSIKPVTASQSLTIIGNDGLRHSLNVGESSKIIAKAGEKYRIVKTHNAIDVLADDVVVTKAGDNLELSYADGTHVTLDGFYSANGSELELPANDGGIHTVTSSEPVLSANESNYVYAHGNHDALMGMTSDNHALQVAVAEKMNVADLPHYAELATGVATDAGAGSAGATVGATTGSSTVAYVSGGIAALVGGVALASHGSGGGNAPIATAAATNTVIGTITAGPILAGNGLSVNIYNANGSTLLGSAHLSSTGTFSVDVGTYTGVIIAKVVNANTGADYMDEATGQGKDLNATLMAVSVVSGGNVTVNINAITTIASIHAGVHSDGSVPSTIGTQVVSDANSAVATAFGLTNILTTEPVTTIGVNGTANSNYNAADGLNAGEKYGAVLASLSGADQHNGGNSQATIDAISGGLSGSTLSTGAQSIIIAGANVVHTDVTPLIDSTALESATALGTDLSTLTSAQISALTPAILASLTTAQLSTLTPAQLTQLDSEQIAVLPDTTPPAPSEFAFTDAGRSATDALSSNPTITLTLASDTATWQYSLDNGTTWTNGTGHTITLAEGTYDKQSVQVKQFDAAGNSSISHMSTTPTIESSAMVQLDGLNQSYVRNESSQITAVGTAGEYVVTFQGYDSTGRYSVFVQKFNADGTEAGTMVQLEALGNTTGRDYSPQITAVGTTGEYVVTFYGQDAVGGDYSVYVQKFNADGTTTNNTMVQLEAIGNTTHTDQNPQITAIGTAGEYVVTFQGLDSTNQWSIFVQKFDATGATVGSMVQLDGLNQSYVYNEAPQITAVGTAGEYVVTFDGYDSTGYYSIFVQKFDANGAVTGAMVQLDGLGNTTGYNYNPQVTAVGTAGEYVVSFDGDNSSGSHSIFVQKFNADGTVAGSMVQLDGIVGGVSNDSAQVTAVGASGEYVVTYTGYDNNWNGFIFVQKFNADGTTAGAATPLEVAGVSIGNDYNPQITAVGTAGEYVVSFEGSDANDGTSIFVQKFHADGTVAGTMSQIDVPNASYNNNYSPQITAVGTAGEFAVTFTGIDSNGNRSIFVQKFRADGTYGADMSNAMIIDTTAPSLAITSADSTNSTNPSISGTAEAGSAITLTVAGATYTTTTASTGTWSVYTGNNPTSGTFTLDPNGGNALSVTATDAAGNVSVAATQTLTVDTVAPATIDPSGLTFTDTGVSASDGITSATTLTVALASDTATWQYSLDGGNSWNTGSGNTITLTDGTYDKHLIQIQQTDAAGNSSTSMMSATPTIPDMVQIGQYASTPQITAVGTTGEYVVTYSGYGVSNGYGQYSIYVQKFAADGTASGAAVVLDGNSTNGYDQVPQVTAVGTTGEYAVTFTGNDSNGNNSIFVQKFDATGATVGSMVQLDGLNPSYVYNEAPQITAVGTTGEYVVTFYGVDSNNGLSIFVQKFNADGTTTNNTMVQLDGFSANNDRPQVTAVGTAGEYVVTFDGYDSTGHFSIFVQKFNADGTTTNNTMVQLDALNNPSGFDYNPQVTAVGTAGEYVVTFNGQDTNGHWSIFVQKFNADGTILGSVVQLDGVNQASVYNDYPQITSVGTTGEFVVSFFGTDSAGDQSIFVQKFGTNGAATGAMVQLEAIGNTTNTDGNMQIAAVGTTGEYAVTFQGINSVGYWSIFVQKFHADGTVAGDMVQLDGGNSNSSYNINPQISAVGTDGGYAVTYQGYNSNYNNVIFVQKFNADGTKAADTHNFLVVDTTISAVITSAATTGDSTPLISGTADAGSSVSVSIAGATYTTTATGGVWSVDTTTATPSSGTLAINANGDNSVSVTATDAAGNVSVAATQTLVVTPPSAPTASLAEDTGVTVTNGVMSVTGNSDRITSNGVVNVTLSSNADTFEYSTDGVNYTAVSSGSTFTLTQGQYSHVYIKEINSGNSVSTAYDMGAITVDTTAPSVASLIVNNDGTVTATSSENTGYTFLIDDRIGLTNPTLIDLTNTITNMPYSPLYYNSMESAVGQDGTTLLNTTTLQSGSFKAYTVDAAGNVSGASSIVYTTSPLVSSVGTTISVVANTSGDIVYEGDVTNGTTTPSMNYVGYNFGSFTAIADSVYKVAETYNGNDASVGVATFSGSANVNLSGINGLLTTINYLGTGADSTSVISSFSSGTDTIDLRTLMSSNIINAASLNLDGTQHDNANISYDASTGHLLFNAAADGIAANTHVLMTLQDSANNPIASLLSTNINTTLPVAPTAVSLNSDTSNGNRITHDSMINVTLSHQGDHFEYSTDGANYTVVNNGTSSFNLSDGVYSDVYVKEIDSAGIVSAAATDLGSVTIDTTPPSGSPTMSVAISADHTSYITTITPHDVGDTVYVSDIYYGQNSGTITNTFDPIANHVYQIYEKDAANNYAGGYGILAFDGTQNAEAFVLGFSSSSVIEYTGDGTTNSIAALRDVYTAASLHIDLRLLMAKDGITTPTLTIDGAEHDNVNISYDASNGHVLFNAAADGIAANTHVLMTLDQWWLQTPVQGIAASNFVI